MYPKIKYLLIAIFAVSLAGCVSWAAEGVKTSNDQWDVTMKIAKGAKHVEKGKQVFYAKEGRMLVEVFATVKNVSNQAQIFSPASITMLTNSGKHKSTLPSPRGVKIKPGESKLFVPVFHIKQTDQPMAIVIEGVGTAQLPPGGQY